MFDGLDIKNNYDDVFIAIKDEILLNHNKLRLKFKFDKYSKLALSKFAKNDRKKFSINKVMSRFKAQKSVNWLLNEGILELEKSREKKPTPQNKKEKLPKYLRRYTIHDKVKFKNHFDRFWFRFIEPNLTLLDNNKIEQVLEIIKLDFENYASLGFEALSGLVLKKYLNLEKDVYSFWTKDLEIDIFYEFDDKVMIGEVKYKDRKVCKSLLNSISLKCEKLNITPDKIIIFSKSGFSKELLNIKSEKLLLFDMDDFTILLE
ncbi:DUF234 domain-containing protein [Campylobacter blaseri]|nr:DUF234 domain-containing protein [Campylobacter blaseri]